MVCFAFYRVYANFILNNDGVADSATGWKCVLKAQTEDYMRLNETNDPSVEPTKIYLLKTLAGSKLIQIHYPPEGQAIQMETKRKPEKKPTKWTEYIFQQQRRNIYRAIAWIKMLSLRSVLKIRKPKYIGGGGGSSGTQ